MVKHPSEQIMNIMNLGLGKIYLCTHARTCAHVHDMCPWFHGSVDSQLTIPVMGRGLQEQRNHVCALVSLIPGIELRTQNRPSFHVIHAWISGWGKLREIPWWSLHGAYYVPDTILSDFWGYPHWGCTTPMRQTLLLFPFYRRAQQGTKNFSVLFKLLSQF